MGLVNERTGNHTRLAAPVDTAQRWRGNASGRRPDDRPSGEVNRAPPPLESEFSVFEAPLEDYDVVELTRFDRPLVRGRVAFGDGFAVVGPVRAVDCDAVAPDHETVVLARQAGEAFVKGADVVYALVDAGAEDRYDALGWTRLPDPPPKSDAVCL
jgi:hypothetical protein